MKLQPDRFALPFIRRSLIGAAVLALCAGHALAVNPFVVKDIRVEGIQRTEAGTVFSYLPVRVGETFDDDKAIAAIKALYATGFFKDVRLEEENGVLVVLVEERPAIASVDFTGTKEFEKDMLIKALKEIGVGETKIFDKASVDRAEQELKRQYLSHGLYGVKITTTVTPIERNRVNVMFNVDEGDIASIKQINIVGNKAFCDKELRELLQLSTSGWFTWYSKADQYSKTKLTGDIEAIKSFYLNRGYLEVNVESTQVSITPDKKDIYLTINITEGEKYTVSGVKLEGEMFGREEELQAADPAAARARPIRASCMTAIEQAHLRPPGHLRLRLRQRQRQPGDRPRQARSGVHLLRRPGQARLRAPHEHLGQHDHPRRSDPPRIPPVRKLVVRRQQDQALARPRRPPRLLQGRDGRHAGSAGHLRPGRRQPDRGRKADR